MSRIDDTAGAVHEAVNQARDKASEVANHVHDIGNRVRDAASETYGQVRDQAKGYIEQGKHVAQDWEKSLEDWVQAKPLQAVVISAGVGLLLGLLWKRR